MSIDSFPLFYCAWQFTLVVVTLEGFCVPNFSNSVSDWSKWIHGSDFLKVPFLVFPCLVPYKSLMTLCLYEYFLSFFSVLLFVLNTLSFLSNHFTLLKLSYLTCNNSHKYVNYRVLFQIFKFLILNIYLEILIEYT